MVAVDAIYLVILLPVFGVLGEFLNYCHGIIDRIVNQCDICITFHARFFATNSMSERSIYYFHQAVQFFGYDRRVVGCFKS